ncbi:MAG: alpha/beta hydrolase [Patescibacteria group bacterium]
MKVLSKDGTEIYYETYGNPGARPQLFFVHGIGGDLDAWQFVLPALLAAGYGALALDLRGSGYSGHPRGAADYAMARMIEDVAAVAQTAGTPVVVVGHSGGAVLVEAFALAHPELVAGLVLIAGSYGPPHYMRSKVLRALCNAGIAVGGLLSPRAGKPWHSPYPPGKHHQEVEVRGLARTMWHNSLASYLYFSRELLRVDLGESLAQIKAPTLLIVGDKDGIYPLATSQTMHAKIAGSVLKVIPGANHVLPLNRPRDTALAMLEFLKTFQI